MDEWIRAYNISFIYLAVWALKEGEQISVLAVLSQLYTVSLGFITTWIGIVLDGSTSIETEIMSIGASIVTELVSILLMIGAAVIGYFVAENQEKKKIEQENLAEEPLETGKMEAVFSDKQMEEYELKDVEEAQKQNI